MTARRADYLARIVGLLLGAGLVLGLVQLATAAPKPIAQVVDPVVAADYGPATQPGTEPAIINAAPAHHPPTTTDKVRVAAMSALGGALGGIVVLGCGYLLELGCKRWGWLRRGWIGSFATTLYSVAFIAGGAVAVGGSWAGAWAVVGTAIVGGRLYARVPKAPAEPVIPDALRASLAAHGLVVDAAGNVTRAAVSGEIGGAS